MKTKIFQQSEKSTIVYFALLENLFEIRSLKAEMFTLPIRREDHKRFLQMLQNGYGDGKLEILKACLIPIHELIPIICIWTTIYSDAQGE